jgi:hypothetical protein
MMRRRTGATGATVLAVITSAALLLPSGQVAAKKASTPTRGTIAGWSGSGADPLAVAATRAGQVSAVFTTLEDEQSEEVTVWESVGDVDGVWAPAEALASDAAEGSPAFAMSRSGASVLAWSVDDGIAQRRLLVSTRSGIGKAWTRPQSVARDRSGFDQMPSVGVARDGRALLAYRHDDGLGAVAVTRTWRQGAWSDPYTHEGNTGVTQLQVAMSEEGYAAFAYDEPRSDPTPDRASHEARYYLYDPAPDRWTYAFGYGAEPHIGIVDVSIDLGTHAIFRTVGWWDGEYWSSIRRWWRHSHDNSECPASIWDCHKQYAYAGPVQIPLERTVDAKVNTSGSGMGLYIGPASDIGGPPVFISESNLTYWEGRRTAIQEGGTSSGIRTAAGINRMAVSWLQDTEGGLEQRVRTLQGSTQLDRGIVVLGPATNPGEVALMPSGHTVVVWAAPDGTIRSHQLEPTRIERVVSEYQVGERAAVQWAKKRPPRATTYDVRVRKGTPKRALGAYSLWKRRTSAAGARYRGAEGRTICFSSRRRGADRTRWTGADCTAFPVDDTALRASEGWVRQQTTEAYKGSRSTSVTAGSTLTLRNVRGRSLAVLAHTSPRGRGKFSVTWGDRDIGTFDTTSDRRRRGRQLLPVAEFPKPVRGDVVIRTIDDATVTIDGVHVSKR